MSEHTINQRIADELVKLAAFRRTLKQENPKEEYSARAFETSSRIIRSWPYEIKSSNDLTSVPGIGPKTKARIDEILRQGYLSELSEQKERLENEKYPKDKNWEEKQKEERQKGEKRRTISLFSGILGVSSTFSELWYNQGYRTLDDLYKKVRLTNTQLIGIKYYDDLQLPIPRNEMLIYDQKFQMIAGCLNKYMNIGIKIEMAGSYRRKLSISRDIDLVLTVQDKKGQPLKEYIQLFITILKVMSIILHDISLGNGKYLGIVRLSGLETKLKGKAEGKVGEYPTRHLDIEFVEPENFPFALLYFTGSKEFNIRMRRFAKEKGYLLNHQGLFEMSSVKKQKEEGAKGEEGRKRVERYFPDERAIFNFLGFTYLAPEKRVS